MEDVSAGIGIFYPIHKNFVRNLMSKLARSTLTSPGTIRVKICQNPDPGRVPVQCRGKRQKGTDRGEDREE